MSNDDNPTGPTGLYGDTPKRRRIDEEEGEEEEEDDDGGGDEDDAVADAEEENEGGGGEEAAPSVVDRRRRVIEARSAGRRRARLLAEAAELREASFPGDEFYVGESLPTSLPPLPPFSSPSRHPAGLDFPGLDFFDDAHLSHRFRI